MSDKSTALCLRAGQQTMNCFQDGVLFELERSHITGPLVTGKGEASVPCGPGLWVRSKRAEVASELGVDLSDLAPGSPWRHRPRIAIEIRHTLLPETCVPLEAASLDTSSAFSTAYRALAHALPSFDLACYTGIPMVVHPATGGDDDHLCADRHHR
jgi:hypothetical protein